MNKEKRNTRKITIVIDRIESHLYLIVEKIIKEGLKLRRLIDEQKLIQDIARTLQPGRPDETEMIALDDLVICLEKIIKKQPTAHDADKTNRRVKWLLDMWQERRNNLLIDLESSPNSQILRANARLYELDKCMMDVKEYFDLILNTPPEPRKDEHGWVNVKDMLPRWISVEEKLPTNHLESVIGWDAFLERCCFVRYCNGEWILRSNNEDIILNIVAWMPTPEPYREDVE